MQEFLDMGGYAAFVWPSYAVALIVLVGLYVMSRRSLKANQDQLESLQQARREARARARGGETQGDDSNDA